jgi:hypothetical protein
MLDLRVGRAGQEHAEDQGGRDLPVAQRHHDVDHLVDAVELATQAELVHALPQPMSGSCPLLAPWSALLGLLGLLARVLLGRRTWGA